MGGFGNPECVTPDTLISTKEGKVSMEDIFIKAKVDWKSLEEGEVIDISDEEVYVLSYNHEQEKVENKRVLSLVRKQDTSTVRVLEAKPLFNEDGNLVDFENVGKELFRASPEHKIYDGTIGGKFSYSAVSSTDITGFGYLDSDYEEGDLLDSFDALVHLGVELTGIKEPILDFQVEYNHNYFANGILSHNTTPGGKALKFYASVRLEIRKIEFISKGTEVIGLKSRIKTTKNKTAPPMRRGEFDIVFGDGFQTENEWGEYIVEYGIIKGKPGGSWFDITNPFNGEEVKVQGKSTGIVQYLDEHPDFKEWAIHETKKRMFPNQNFEELTSTNTKVEIESKIDQIVEENESVTEMDDVDLSEEE